MSSSSQQPPAPSGGVNIAVAVGVPILIVIITIVIVLLLILGFLYYRARQRRKEPDSKGAYAPLPTQDDTSISLPPPRSPLPTKSSPYSKKQSISLDDPPPPTMQFTMATQLDKPSKSGGGLRYPFMEPHKHPEGRNLRDTRPPKQRTKKKGNHKHGNGRHMVLKPGDTSSDLSDQSSGLSDPRPRMGGKRPSLGASPSLSEPEELSPLAQSEIYFILKFDEEAQSFVVSIDRVESLPARADGSGVDSYVRLFLIPRLTDLSQRKTAKTQTKNDNLSPIFNEDIHYDKMSRDELINTNLHVEVLDYQSNGKHQLLGKNMVQLANITFVEGEAPMKLALNPPEERESLGTVNLSICYSPDNKRLSVIILRAKGLNRGNYKETDPQAKLWVTMSGEKVLGKLKTKKKLQSSGPIFNEPLNCTVEPSKISGVAVNVTITNEHRQAANKMLGQVTLCAQSTGEEFRHWSDVMATPGRPIAEWHELR